MLKQLVNNLFTAWAKRLVWKWMLLWVDAIAFILSPIKKQEKNRKTDSDSPSPPSGRRGWGMRGNQCAFQFPTPSLISRRDGRTKLMRQKQVWLAILAAFSTVISLLLAPASAQTGLSDIEGHWAQPCITELIEQQIINGYPDGTFRPSEPVTRAEFAGMLSKAFPNTPKVREPIQFVDIPSDYWAGDDIRQANQTGFLSGYLGRIFNPLLKITREQVLVALVSGLKYQPTQPVSETLNAAFDDAQQVPVYARNAIAAATERQLVVNYPDVRTLSPTQLASRGDVAAVLCQALGVSGLVPVEYIAQPGLPLSMVKTVASQKQNIAQSSEIRGVWLTNIDSDVLFSRANLNRGLERLKRLNFNTVYPTVWNWGYTLYPSRVAKEAFGQSLDPTPGLKGRDMLKEVVEQGHQRGLTVIPWFEFGFMAPADSELAKKHPEWLTQRRDGSKVWKEGEHDRVWLNPFHPEVQQFILDLVTEIVANYDIDGIQFDDHFGLPAEFGYDKFTVNLFKKELKGLSPSDAFYETFWVRWRADKINDFMARLAQSIKAIKPDCIISLSPNPLHFSLPAHLQDWFTWERKDLIQELVLQVYRDDIDRFTTELGRTEVELAQTRIPVSVGILTGLKNSPRPMTQIQNQVQAVRDRNFAGVSFFFYESLWQWAKETPTQRESAFKNLFAAPASRPDKLQGI